MCVYFGCNIYMYICTYIRGASIHLLISNILSSTNMGGEGGRMNIRPPPPFSTICKTAKLLKKKTHISAEGSFFKSRLSQIYPEGTGMHGALCNTVYKKFQIREWIFLLFLRLREINLSALKINK